MKIYLLDRKQNMIKCWKQYFAGIDNVEIVYDDFANFMDTYDVECVVSPANSFGLMDGGYDLAITKWFGTELMLKVQKYIIDNGVYFLFCRDKVSGEEAVYIGQSENVHERLKQHIYDYSTEKEKYFWHTAVVFLGPDLNKAYIRYLENRLVEIARECKRFNVLTKCTYRHSVSKEADIASLEKYIRYIQMLLNVLGYRVLEP